MTATPTRILGPIILRTNGTYSGSNFPGFTFNPSAPFTPSNPLLGSAKQNELIARSYTGLNVSGITSDYISHLFLRNDVETLNYMPLYSSFIPDYYIGINDDINLTFNQATNTVSLPGGLGSSNDRYEVIQFSYSTDIFLKNLSGSTGIAMTGFTYSHSIYPGNTTINANQIFYRKLGRI